MNKELLGIGVIFLTTVLLAVPLGRYLATIYRGDKSWSDFLLPFERLLYRLGGVRPEREMSWQQHLLALLAINVVWFGWAMFVLCTQGSLPLNPDHNPSMTPDQAFNTAISFLVNCNLQHYSGESGATYFSQVFCLMFLQFVTAATGMAACVVVFNALREGAGDKLGNFYVYFVRSITRVLLPLSLVVALVVVSQGTPMTWLAKAPVVTVQGDSTFVSRGPAAALIGIKQIGTNAAATTASTLLTRSKTRPSSPTPSRMALSCSFPLPWRWLLATTCAGPRLGWMVFGVMTAGYLLLQVPTVYLEMHGNPAITHLGVDQRLGSLEGKEMRLGAPASALWAIQTTVTSNGSVNAMHDSLTPLSGMNALLGMMTNAFLWGGRGRFSQLLRVHHRGRVYLGADGGAHARIPG